VLPDTKERFLAEIARGMRVNAETTEESVDAGGVAFIQHGEGGAVASLDSKHQFDGAVHDRRAPVHRWVRFHDTTGKYDARAQK
jgi:hypothetical protein